MEIMKNK